MKIATNRIGNGFRRTAWIGFVLGIAIVPMTVWLADRPPTTGCNDGSWLNSSDHVILASKVVVQPWYGRHHVYGIFVIPSQYSDTEYSTTATVRGVKGHAALEPAQTALPGQTSVNVHGNNIPIKSGYFVKHAHIQTRVAFWFLMTGHFGDLRATCNWALVFANKKS